MSGNPGIIRDNSNFFHSLANHCFFGAAYCGPADSNFSHVQLWNPNASGHNLYVNTVKGYVESPTANILIITRFATVLSTGGGAEGNKNLGAAAGVGVLQIEDNVAILGTRMAELRRPVTSEYLTFDYRHEIIIPQNMGLIVVGGFANFLVGGYFEWREVPI